MATYKSGQTTNNQANPRVMNSNGKDLNMISGVTTLGSAIATADLLQLIEVPFNAKIRSLKIFNTDFGTVAPVGVGIAYGNGCGSNALGTLITGSAAVAAAYALDTASSVGVEVRFNVLALTTEGQNVWEMAGLSADPGGTAIFLGTVGAVTAGATGSVLVQVIID